jgi:ATP-dependent Lon protease
MTENLPVLILNKHVLLPYQELKLDFHEDKTKEIINYAYDEYNKKVLVIFSSLDNNDSDFPKIGVIGNISKKLALSTGNLRVIINGLNRVQVKSYDNNN